MSTTDTSPVHIEREEAAFITGNSEEETDARIDAIWAYVESDTDHYRAPGYIPVSSPELIEDTKIKNHRSELRTDRKAGRHILYMDTLDLAFRRANIQVRLEIKQKREGIKLREKFAEVTIKIGDKADQRIEESVNVDLDVWERDGFYTALKSGMKKTVGDIRSKKGGDIADKKDGKFCALKKAFKTALRTATDQEPKRLKPFPLVHLHRDTREAEYSPNGHRENIVEIKTDRCEWETPLEENGQFVQLEVEDVAGTQSRCEEEMERLERRFSNFIERTSDSKEDAGMRSMEPVLMPQDDSEAEQQRVLHNRQVLERHLHPYKFCQIDPRANGIRFNAA